MEHTNDIGEENISLKAEGTLSFKEDKSLNEEQCIGEEQLNRAEQCSSKEQVVGVIDIEREKHPYRERNKGVIILLLTTMIWSLAFIAQSTAMDQIGPFAFVFYRHLLSGLCLLPFAFLKPIPKEERRESIKGGIITGIVLGLASVIQQFGVKETTVGKAAFLTTLYIILIPIFALIIGKKPKKKIWFCAILALLGVYFIAIKTGTKFTIGAGDRYIIFCAALYAIQIMQVDYYVKKVKMPWFMSMQFFAGSLVGLLGFILFEEFSFGNFQAALLPIAYAGIMSGAVAFSMQSYAQKRLEATVASLLMSTTAVYAAIWGWLFLGESLGIREIFGCLIMAVAVVYAQLPGKKKENSIS